MTTETLMGQDNTDPGQGTADAGGANPQPAQGTADQTTPPADQQVDGAKPGEQGKEGEQKPADKTDDKPVEYTDFQAPEGIELDGDLLGEFKTVAAEFKLPQEQAQKLVDLGAKLVQKQVDAFHETQSQWVESITTDKEVGGDKLDESKALVAKTMSTFATPELRQMLKDTGMGNNPELFKFAHRIGKAISEDGFVRGQPAAQSPQDTATSFYPTMKK